MYRYSIRAYAKVNLVLDVIKKSELGYHAAQGAPASGSSRYHEIQTVLHEVDSLYDEIIFDKGSAGVTFFSKNPRLIFDEANTIVRAIALFEKKFSKKVGGHFSVTKNIPLRSGLGGGSSDAAATLKLLVRAYQVHCCGVDTQKKSTVDSCHELHCPLFDLARAIGMDVPFFINGGTQLATHFGEKLMPLMSASPFLQCTIIDTGVEVLTADAYNALDLSVCGENMHLTRDFLTALSEGDGKKIFESLHNDFDQNPVTTPHKKTMLTGSGGAKVGISMVK